MEAAPLTRAHALARDAAQRPPLDAVAAAEQLQKAAAEFTNAADGVQDAEALRILKLLESHHDQLAEIVKSLDRPGPSDATSISSQTPTTATPSSNLDAPPSSATNSSESAAGQPPRSSSPVLQRLPRESTPSLATNLATARGIPTVQQRHSRQASGTGSTRVAASRSDHRQPNAASSGVAGLVHGNLPSETTTEPRQTYSPSSRGSDLRASRVAQTSVTAKSPADTSASGTKEDGFQKFYTSFEGLLSKLSAPLAFAGLPLVSEDQTEPAQGPSSEQTPGHAAETTSQAGSDMTKLFSRAALQAVKEDNPGLGALHESYFVVPGTSGMSYANVLSRNERSGRRASTDAAADADDEATEQFVDAKESPQSRSPKASRKDPQSPSQHRTVEELELENESLKQMTDNLSRRLYMWEKSAQSQSMALQQSIRGLQPSAQESPVGAGAGGGADPAAEERIRELEEQVVSAKREVERYEKENEKLKGVVMRYRERWEKLKEGARVRREGNDKGADAA